MAAQQLENLSYRELQAECKKAGVAAKGTKLELLGRLMEANGYQTKQDTPYKSPLFNPPVEAPSRRKSVDAKTVKAAMKTPLPKSPATRSRRGGAAKSAAPMDNRRTIAVAAAIFIAVVASGIGYCQQTNSCPSQLQNTADFVGNQVQYVRDSTSAAVSNAKNSVAEFASALREKIASSNDSPVSAGTFNGAVSNEAIAHILQSVASGEEWENAATTLKDILSGRKLEQGKANVVLFACPSGDHHDTIATALESGVPADGLASLPQGAVGGDKAALQRVLVEFLVKEPKGIIFIEALDTVPVDALSVLMNVMGEGGALTHNGREVSANEATFVLTMTASQGVQESDKDAKFNSRAKRELSSALLEQLGSNVSEEAEASVKALRRRIDLVVKMV